MLKETFLIFLQRLMISLNLLKMDYRTLRVQACIWEAQVDQLPDFGLVFPRSGDALHLLVRVHLLGAVGRVQPGLVHCQGHQMVPGNNKHQYNLNLLQWTFQVESLWRLNYSTSQKWCLPWAFIILWTKISKNSELASALNKISYFTKKYDFIFFRQMFNLIQFQNKEWIHVDTTPLYAMVRFSGAALGLVKNAHLCD